MANHSPKAGPIVEHHGLLLRASEATDGFLNTDWAASPLGPVESWSTTLRVAVQLCLNSRFPVTLCWGRELTVIYNDGYIPIMGRNKHPGAFGRPALDVYAEIEDFLRPLTASVMEQGETIWQEDQHVPIARHGEPQEGYFTFSYSPVRDPDGRIQGLISIATETTDHVVRRRRTAAGRLLSDVLVRLRTFDPVIPAITEALESDPMDFARVALFTLDDDATMRTTYVRPPEFEQQLDAESLVRPILERVARWTEPDASVEQVDGRRHAITVGGVSRFMRAAYILVLEPDPLVSADAEYRRYLKILRDVIAGAAFRIALEQDVYSEVTRQLDERDRLYRMLFEYSGDAISIAEPTGTVIAANPEACAISGYDESEITGRALSEFIDNGDGSLDRARSQLFDRGRYDGEMTIRRKDGRTVPVDLSAVLFRDSRTDTRLIITQLRDAAPRHENQERMKSSARLEAIGQLTGGISHDFNNLLNVIINGAEDLADTLAADHPGRDSANLVLSASLKAADLTRQLQAFSRQQPMQVRTLPVAEVLEELRGFLERAIGSGIQTAVDVAPGIEVHVDPSHLQSALLNLGINARDAMPEGGTLTLSARHCRLDGAPASRLDLPEGPYVEICVADTGVGIAPEHLDRVVEPFFTTKGFGEGTGLGLSTAYGFARQSGGALTIDSTPGSGTRVLLYFPVPPDDAQADAADAAESDPVYPGNGQHLLVVEDNDLLGAMLQRILHSGGYRVTLETQGESALAALAAMPDIDLVITDIVLGGGIDGWQVAREVRASRPDCPVITMSGYAPGDGSMTVPDSLPTLRKPFRPREILTLVGKVLTQDPDQSSA